MPNERNIAGPITSIGMGRSGTTLLQACFQAHPEVQALNETAGLIFGLAAGAHECPLPSKQHFQDEAEFAGHVIRNTFIATEPSHKPVWYHKPIGLPKLINWGWQDGRRTASGFPVEWYWKVLQAAFPHSIYVVCLRNPWDVVLSYERFTGWAQVDVWRDIADLYEAIEIGSEKLQHVFFFDDLIEEPEKALRDVCDSVGARFISDMLSGFAERQAMRAEDPILRDHRMKWPGCVDPRLPDADIERIVRIWRSKGRQFDSPLQHKNLFRF